MKSSSAPSCSSSASRSSERSRAARSAGSSIPALVETSTSRAHPRGRGQRDVQRDAPAERVAAQREALRCALQHVRDASGEGDRPRAVSRPAVPGQIERQRQVAFSVQVRDDAVPGTMGAAEPVQQDDALGHEPIL